MHSSTILTLFLATLVLATPVDRRALTTKIEVYTVWTTVTRGAAEVTGSSDGRSAHSNGYSKDRSGGRKHRSLSTIAESYVAASSSVVIVPSSTVEPASSSSVVAPPPSSTSTAVETSPEAPTPSETPAASPPAPTPSPEAPSKAVTPDSNTSSTPPAPAPAASSPPPVPNAPSSYAQAILTQHNIHRDNHTDTGPLAWSDQLAATALKIANSCVYAHDTATDNSQYPSGYGQNIGAGAPPEDIPAMITNGMYNDEAPAYEGLYGQDDPDMSNFHKWGHFSQIVWRNTKEVGCATVQCGTLQNTGGNVRPFFTVCNYSPPGNFGGQYTNVGVRLGKATVSL